MMNHFLLLGDNLLLHIKGQTINLPLMSHPPISLVPSTAKLPVRTRVIYVTALYFPSS